MKEDNDSTGSERGKNPCSWYTITHGQKHSKLATLKQYARLNIQILREERDEALYATKANGRK